jgi:hypothetical protein
MALGVCSVGVSSMLALAGCSGGEAAERPAPPPVDLVRPAAASAGGACILWDFADIADELGVQFDVAAADQVDDTSTCVVQAQGASRPDLVLSVVEQTTADAALFTADLQPARAKAAKGLGKAAYQLVSPPAGDHGPAVEVGWLTADRQLMSLRFTFAKGEPVARANAMAGRLIKLAKKLDSGS